jgi:hypothetical protein
LELEIEPVGYLREGGTERLVAPSLVANYGFAARWEAVLAGESLVPLHGPDHRVAVAGTELSVKTVLREGVLQGATGPSLATEFGALLPTLHDEPGVGAFASLIASETSSVGTVHVNVLGERTRAHHAGGFVGLILEAPDAWRARPVLEVFYERDGAEETLSELAGAIVRVSERVDLDGGARVAWSVGESVFELRAGLTWAVIAPCFIRPHRVRRGRRSDRSTRSRSARRRLRCPREHPGSVPHASRPRRFGATRGR